MRTGIILPLIMALSMIQTGNSDDTELRAFAPHGGISIQTGAMSTVMRDEYISKESYSDSYPFATIGWTHTWAGGAFEISVSHGNTESLSNGNLSSWYEHTALGLDLVYRLTKAREKAGQIEMYLGPSVGFSSYYFSHTFASPIRYESEGSLFSLGLRSRILYPLRPKIALEFDISSSVLSIVQKSFDYQRYPDLEGDAKLVPMFSSGSTEVELAIRAKLTEKLSLKTGYGLALTRIGEWDEYREARNLFSLELGYGL
ncbi:hypothetical protein ACFL4U_01535 [Candidatus Neomarinimicrobiota bacterium]